jgi:hypothetical protein
MRALGPQSANLNLAQDIEEEEMQHDCNGAVQMG